MTRRASKRGFAAARNRLAEHAEDRPLDPSLVALRDLIDGDPVLRLYAPEMINQVPTTKHYSERHLDSVNHMLLRINEVLHTAPEFSTDAMVMTPIGAILGRTMATPQAWCRFLDGPDSRYVINDSGRVPEAVPGHKERPDRRHPRSVSSARSRPAGCTRAGGLRRRCGWFSPAGKEVLVSRTEAINELKGLTVVAPDQLRAQLRSCSLSVLLTRIEQLPVPAKASVAHRLSMLTMQSTTARIRFLSAQLADLDPQLLELTKQHPAGPALLAHQESDQSSPPSC